VPWCLVDEKFYKDEKMYMERKTRDRISLDVRCSMYWGKLCRWFLGTALLEIKGCALPLKSEIPASWAC
jgi:hypothetical protein